jgi:hypothetical protein
MARQKSPKKSDPLNAPAAAGAPAVHSTSAHEQTAPAVAAQPTPVKPAPAEPKNGDARKPEILKPEIVKKESRANLVPINLDDEVRRLAYLLSERRGFAPGREAEDWINAEREVRERYHQQSA